ncbi:GNAT family N-acetyltransferase [Riemerella columbina]|uniref:GNAT family N-acetyltransferase n=1 Tax=Riemerella columbina TaxID=103810 RepID=UPI00266F7BA3|nr:GNAT family N-acetyltransferase [Riemerella columbina]WKS94398.1 GNAT family N-acetyltransferase [Riemerella columbina]
MSENSIEISRATLLDVQDLQIIAQTTFKDTFGQENSEENMIEYLQERFSIKQLSSELENENSEFYFAKKGKLIIGYLKVNTGTAQTELQENNSLEIERIYVASDHQGQNVGKQLYEKALHIAKEKELQSLWLGVWEENKKAIAFYEKNGFQKFSQHTFKLGGDEQIDWLMRKTLSQSSLLLTEIS